MVIEMNEQRLTDLAQLRGFLEGTAGVEFRGVSGDEDRYRHIESVVRRFGYRRLKRPDKAVVLRYLERTTGYSRQQLTRLVGRAAKGERLRKAYRAPAKVFERRYTAADVALLAHTDVLHGTLSGPATRHLMNRALNVYGDQRYARLATISRHTCTTCASAAAIGCVASTGRARARYRSPSANAGRRRRTAARASSASTASIRGTRTG